MAKTLRDAKVGETARVLKLNGEGAAGSKLLRRVGSRRSRVG